MQSPESHGFIEIGLNMRIRDFPKSFLGLPNTFITTPIMIGTDIAQVIKALFFVTTQGLSKELPLQYIFYEGQP